MQPTHQWFLFPGRHGKGHIRPDSASRILRKAMNRIGLEGNSTHLFRRAALTTMNNSGIPLRIIQAVSGHRSLEVLEEYLAVGDEQVRGAITALSQLSYVKKTERDWRNLPVLLFASHFFVPLDIAKLEHSRKPSLWLPNGRTPCCFVPGTT